MYRVLKGKGVMCKMKKLCVSFIAIMMFLFCNSAFASGPLMLEYDGGTHEYNGEVYS